MTMEYEQQIINNTDCHIFEGSPDEGILTVAHKAKLSKAVTFNHSYWEKQGLKLAATLNLSYFYGNNIVGGYISDGGYYSNKAFRSDKQFTTLIYKDNKLILDEEWQEKILVEKYKGYNFIVQVGDPLVKYGVPYIGDGKFSHADSRNPRSFLGQKKDGTFIFFASDGRTDKGFTIQELRQVAIDLGCETAINTDGGGSSTLVIQDKMVNTNENRSIASVVMFYSKSDIITQKSKEVAKIDVKPTSYAEWLNSIVIDGIKLSSFKRVGFDYIYLTRDEAQICGLNYDKLLDTSITENFTLRELSCKHTEEYTRKGVKYTYSFNELLLNEKVYNHALHVQEERSRMKKTFKVNSWFRSNFWNLSEGGEINSTHEDGIATDISLGYSDRTSLSTSWKSKKYGGIGLYATFIHIDSRGYLSTWKG